MTSETRLGHPPRRVFLYVDSGKFRGNWETLRKLATAAGFEPTLPESKSGGLTIVRSGRAATFGELHLRPLQPEIAELDLGHAPVGVMEHDALDVLPVEPSAKPVEVARRLLIHRE